MPQEGYRDPKKFVIHPEPKPKKKISKYQAML